MIPFQLQLESALQSFHTVATIMQMRWSWSIVESAHFIGLTLLFGPIAVWDLRLIGLMKGVPAVAFHRLIPCAVAGFAVNLTTGCLFLMTYPDQYVYNSAFHLKVLCILMAGLNVAVFYVTMFRRMAALGPREQLPPTGRLAGVISLTLWITVIVCGRMITFFRPSMCSAADVVGVFLADCAVR